MLPLLPRSHAATYCEPGLSNRPPEDGDRREGFTVIVVSQRIENMFFFESFGEPVPDKYAA